MHAHCTLASISFPAELASPHQTPVLWGQGAELHNHWMPDHESLWVDSMFDHHTVGRGGEKILCILDSNNSTHP